VTGVLDGNVTCDTMNVKGNFAGSLDCRDLTIGSRAVVDGKVSFNSITIQRGGVVEGELKKKREHNKLRRRKATEKTKKPDVRQAFLF
jgi:cytoskeletal protein CcmA (bactofilin family)